MAWLRTLQEKKYFVAGLVVAPLGLYVGLRIKQQQAGREIEEVRHGVASAQVRAEPPTVADDIRAELLSLHNARNSLRRQESLLSLELDSVHAKLQRLDRQGAQDSG
ncbi:hypothetical protein LPJ61_005284 [Coemansia biformis]|uniref:Uncharacterized protein n=1 Tax=Coemansia biformis TaxID=1286918 RepID=A0A9W8CWF6_9FUNG|nr:hypothetical protein LPJ61_005284 [Coemansia biformis]